MSLRSTNTWEPDHRKRGTSVPETPRQTIVRMQLRDDTAQPLPTKETNFTFDPATKVRFPVTPPTRRTATDDRTRLRDAEGWIEVHVDKNGDLFIRGYDAMEVLLEVSNCIRLRLRDDL